MVSSLMGPSVDGLGEMDSPGRHFVGESEVLVFG